ncbi:hypothetical protein NQ315_001441 [Exocentrus adspersus]|uniref:Uncharacterized protein n=1 Tax=Exocentrus adspersus TaxID=1586481 RepID=A0AAV8W8N8_9CUCU|nr:hypothetical protein NQ315_001441 [Exocentrus adspersus]
MDIGSVLLCIYFKSDIPYSCFAVRIVAVEIRQITPKTSSLTFTTTTRKPLNTVKERLGGGVAYAPHP